MADQPVLSQCRTSEPVVTLSGDLSTGRQLRKSCRFCRSRKIRCSGETDIGCLACRDRNQRCVYEPTASMGRPRKYPRTEYCGEPGTSMPPDLQCHPSAPCFQRGWPHSTVFMRTLQTQEYFQGPPRSFESAHAAWRPLDEQTSTTFNFNPSANALREDPFLPTLGRLPVPLNHQNVHSLQNPHGSDSALLNGMLSAAVPATSVGNSGNFHHSSTSQPEFEGCGGGGSSRRVSLEQSQIDNIPMDFARAHFLNDNHSTLQSPPSVLPSDPNALVSTHEIISTCDPGHIFQHFKGTTLHITTQAHSQFILREYPNLHVPFSPHKHPSVLGPSLYYTMLADVVSCIACAQASVSDRQDGSLNTQPLFIEMLNFDRGENSFQESIIIAGEGRLNPLEQLSIQELDFIYSRWLSANPFAFLFNDTAPSQQYMHLPENSALLAAVVGWHFYLTSRTRDYDLYQTPNHHSQNLSTRYHMPFFEYAEAELMGEAMCINRSTLSTVQGLVLLGTFRSVDSQARCGWALLSVAHLLAKEYLSPANGLKRPRSVDEGIGVQESQMLGINWLMCLYKSWTLLSMKFPKWKVNAMIINSPSYLEAFLIHARATPSSPQANAEWANRTLLNAGQILEVFSTLCQEDPSNSLLREPMAMRPGTDRPYESNLYLIRWLMRTAKRRCQVTGAYDSPPSNNHRATTYFGREVRNAHVNIVLAVVFSIFALSRLVPLEDMAPTNFSRIPLPIFRDVLKLLQIISAEGADSIVASAPSLHHSSPLGEALLLRLLRGLVPNLLILLQALVNTLPDYCNTPTVDSTYLIDQLFEVIEPLGRFASAGLSLYPLEDFQVIEDIRVNVVSLSATLAATSQLGSSQDYTRAFQSGAFQSPSPVAFFEAAHNFMAKTSQPRDHITHEPFEKPPSDRTAHEPFEQADEYVVTEREPLLTNSYLTQSANLLAYSAPTTVDCIVPTLARNNGAQLSDNLMSSADVGGILSSPPLSDPPSSASYPFQSRHDDSQVKTDEILIPSQGTDLNTELNSEAFGCPRGAEQYFCPLDSWIPQPSLHQMDLGSHPQPSAVVSFPSTTRTANPLSPPAGSPSSYC